MTYLLDTDTCVAFLRRGRSTVVAAKLAAKPPDAIALCSVVVAELLYGARRSQHSTKTLTEVRAFCGKFTCLPFDAPAAEEYSVIRAQLADQGLPIGPNDLMIAAIALAHGLILVTHNTAEFQRVSGLLIEDWQVP